VLGIFELSTDCKIRTTNTVGMQLAEFHHGLDPVRQRDADGVDPLARFL
jgi:hypothetical protein